MHIVRFSPGDSTTYRAAWEPLTPSQSNSNRVGDQGIFFAFGLGDRPLVGQVFDRSAPVHWNYFCEKLPLQDEVIGQYMAWLTLHAVCGWSLPQRLPRWDGEDVAGYWYRRLKPNWPQLLLATNESH